MSEVTFPAMSEEADATGVLSTWFVESGEQVRADQLIAEVAMDKVDTEVVAPAAGTITLAVDEGAEVRQGSVIARIE
ncbi:lipoyl domain-containing protein [Aldersonia sp. NBC_00410]|uniref:lipoyl domain-containing protein n=1 Tax=Aldersonia sp. NBC_00410 TaxID=2975954 RepID=UPI00225A45C5|nr:lipoyl domain-containing protein [Aldersonia sp. NBC_00410]MCX5045145.1 lipoyl domain-containing protein [Aldersonia sp. NBC_00410]